MAKKTQRAVKQKSTTGRVGTAHQGRKESAAKKGAVAVSKPARLRKSEKALPKLEKLATGVVAMAQRKADPAIAIPTRSLSNVSYNEKTRHIEMRDNKQSRNFFNYGQAKRFMQTMLVASKCKDLTDTPLPQMFWTSDANMLKP